MAKSAEELLENAYKTYIQDKARFGNPNYQPYRGQTTAPMSSLTQKAREYQQQYAQRPLPYAKKINTLNNKSNVAIPPQQLQELLNNIRQSQQGVNENIGIEALRNQFGQLYAPQRQQNFRNILNQDIDRGLGEFSGTLQDLNKTASNLEAVKNNILARNLGLLQGDKLVRRQGLIGNLDQFGNQKHAHTNKTLSAEKAKFEEEQSAPQQKLEQLAAALEPHRNRLANGALHPDLERSTAQEIQKALQDYQTPYSAYPGRTVAPLSAEMQASHNLLERISPSVKDTYSPQRKDIIKRFLGDQTSATRALSNLPAGVQGKLIKLEHEARERMQNDLAAINNQYIRLGQYGSSQHINEAERRAQEINKRMLELRNADINENLRNQISLQHEGDIGDIRKLQTLSQAGNQEFGSMIGDVRNLNKVGATRWRNDQDELEDIYKNYQKEFNWTSPFSHAKNANLEATRNNMFGNQAARDLQLDNLNNVAAKYSELQKEPNKIVPDIRSSNQFNNVMAAQPAQISAIQQSEKQKQAEELTEKQKQMAEIDNRKKMSFPPASRLGWGLEVASRYPFPYNILSTSPQGQQILRDSDAKIKYDATGQVIYPSASSIYPSIARNPQTEAEYQQLNQYFGTNGQHSRDHGDYSLPASYRYQALQNLYYPIQSQVPTTQPVQQPASNWFTPTPTHPAPAQKPLSARQRELNLGFSQWIQKNLHNK